MSKPSAIVEKAVADFLRHLRERNASPHTIKAYSGDLANFAAYAGSRGWKSDRPHRDSRISLAALRKRTGEDFRRAVAGGGAVAVSLAGAGRRGRTESRKAGGDAQAAEKTSARAHHRRDELRARWPDAGSGGLPRARPAHAGTALWMRHSQLGTNRHQRRRHPPERGSNPDSRQGEEGALRSVWRFRKERAGGLSSGAPGNSGARRARIQRHC